MSVSPQRGRLVAPLLLAGFVAAFAAEAYGSGYADHAIHYKAHQQHADMDYDKLPRKAAIVKDTVKSDKSALLKVTLTLDKSTQSCPSKHRDMDHMRQYVADSFDTMLRRAHVDAHFKTGKLGCEATIEHDCVKVALQFVVRLHTKKGSELLPKFIEVVTMSRYSHREICSIQELNCEAHHVASIEAEQLTKKPKGTKLFKYIPDVEDTADDDEHKGKTYADHSTWTHSEHDGKKKKGDHHADKHKGVAFKHELYDHEDSDDGANDGNGANGDEEDGENGDGAYGSVGGYGLRAAMMGKACIAAAANQRVFKVDTRLWPEEALQAAASDSRVAIATASAAAARTAAAPVAAAPQQLKTATFDTRLWPDTLIMPWQKMTSPVV